MHGKIKKMAITNNRLFFLKRRIDENMLIKNMIDVLFCRIGINPFLMNLKIASNDEALGMTLRLS